MRLARYAGLVVIAACLFIPGSAAGFSGHVLRGFGTATIDGSMGTGEWGGAGHADFTVNRSSSEGGGTVPATVYVMNDATNLYIAIKVVNATVASSAALVHFDGDHNSRYLAEGEDVIHVDTLGEFHDRFMHQTSPTTWTPAEDTTYGGTEDGDERDGDATGYSFFEFAHPLDTSDNAHDVSLARGSKIGFQLIFEHCYPCAGLSVFPSTSLAEIVIVSGSRVPPDTQVTSGPREGSGSNKTNPTFQFSGTDDVLQPSELTFECMTDEGAWEACTSPKRLELDEGRHTFSVRAVDEMLNVDQSPEQRNWTVDHTPPSRPAVRGRRSVRQGQRVVLRFSARDGGIGGVYFKCSVDSRVLRRCPARYRVKLGPGRHVVRVRAYDRIGNRGALTMVRVTVKRTQG
jgi:hypothetical protein